MDEGQLFTVVPSQAGLTVLAALRQWLPGTSWSGARKLVAGRHVAVSGSLCLDEARRLRLGESVAISKRRYSPPALSPDVRLIYHDADLLVVDKPAGMTTLRHRAERGWSIRRKRRQPTLDDVLPELLTRSKGAPKRRGGAGPIYPVHRIDRETSGLLVFARTPAARAALIEQFRSHTIGRIYLAVVYGDVRAATFQTFLVRDRGDGLRGSSAVSGRGKRAITHVRPVEKLVDSTLLECRLETGRTHQIRIHLAEAGHPVIGDRKYGRSDSPLDCAAPKRLALHAATLEFAHPSQSSRLRFESALPPSFVFLLDQLRWRASERDR